jgi:hypothetical protein
MVYWGVYYFLNFLFSLFLYENGSRVEFYFSKK